MSAETDSSLVSAVDTVVWLNGTYSLAVNGQRLTFRDDPRLTFHRNHTLEIRNLMPTDSGAYTCKINEALQLHHEIDLFGKVSRPRPGLRPRVHASACAPRGATALQVQGITPPSRAPPALAGPSPLWAAILSATLT